MTANSTAQTSEKIVDEGRATLEKFVGYLVDLGIQAQMLEAITMQLPAHGDTVPKDIFSQAFGDVVDTSTFGAYNGFNLERIINGAASLELLVRYARTLPEQIFPRGAIPTDKVVSACLELFHHRMEIRIKEASADAAS